MISGAKARISVQREEVQAFTGEWWTHLVEICNAMSYLSLKEIGL